MGLSGTSANKHFLRGNELYKRRQMEKAIKEYREAIRLEPDNYHYHGAVAELVYDACSRVFTLS